MKYDCLNFRLFLLLFLILCGAIAVPAQYKGDPVKRDRLINTLRSKQFQTRDIIQVINENGVDFRLDAATQKQLVAAGARPPVLDAVRRNYRGDNRSASSVRGGRATGGDSYNALLDDAVAAYDQQRNQRKANELLQRAVNLQPNNPRAYQLLGFLNLYGAKNFNEAERYWKKSISLGGAAVLRVTHDHDGSFLTTCEGSLYISRNIVRFESDDNVHTFETTDANIKKIEVNSTLRRLFQLRGGSFKMVLGRDDRANWNFAPLSGKTDESKMIIRLIGKG